MPGAPRQSDNARPFHPQTCVRKQQTTSLDELVISGNLPVVVVAAGRLLVCAVAWLMAMQRISS